MTSSLFSTGFPRGIERIEPARPPVSTHPGPEGVAVGALAPKQDIPDTKRRRAEWVLRKPVGGRGKDPGHPGYVGPAHTGCGAGQSHLSATPAWLAANRSTRAGIPEMWGPRRAGHFALSLVNPRGSAPARSCGHARTPLLSASLAWRLCWFPIVHLCTGDLQSTTGGIEVRMRG